ncbi:Hypothetical protein R9X50_00431300 [Acrodontium crateriforme]|uniref:Uncharacterized protein n=1 Tax=Acrodontium crateriforme TaxID=150365 RepID=A0AAQ3M449_9PEZI|nr:Hypothetical protein R9X50_00431300 [Acrodontium crateriforme]
MSSNPSTASQSISPLPFTIHASGHAEIPHASERGVMNVIVSSSGTNQAAVSDEVLTTSRHVEDLLRAYEPSDNTPEAELAAPLAHWNRTSLGSTSHVPYVDNDKPPKPRMYTCKVTFDISFKDFKALGAFGAKLTALPHVEMNNINWILTPATERSFKSQLRREAALDALQKAQDYCEALGCTNPRPVNLTEEGLDDGRNEPPPGMHAQPHMRLRSAAPSGQGEKTELEFRPQEVKMTMNLTVKFHADPPGTI